MENALPHLLNLAIVDSVKVNESNFFLNSLFQVQLIGDSLLGVASYRSPGVGFYHISGAQRKRIASGDYPIGYFLPSYFDASEYPIVYILDKKSESVLVFQVEKQELIKKIKLDLPDGKEIKIMESKLKKIKDGFLVELASSEFEQINPKYYKESGKLIHFFDENGRINGDPFLEYPDVIKNIKGSLKAIDYLKLSASDESLYFAFPHEQSIKHYDAKDLEKLLEEIPLPKSRYFDFQLKGAEEVYSFEEMNKSGTPQKFDIPNNHYFNSIHEAGHLILIQTWLVADKNEGLNRKSHLMIYNKKEEQWYETSNPRNILDIGMLAGVVSDTLYFFEGSLMQSDEKYIKRAVLRPTED